MTAIIGLWLPILAATAAVFIVSFLVWAVLPWHRNDYNRLPDQEGVRAALHDTPPGQYNVPHVTGRADLETPQGRALFERGPVGFIVLTRPGLPNMGRRLAQWTVAILVVSVLAAYVATSALGPGAPFGEVFRHTATVSALAYGFAYVQEGIWFARPWRFVGKMIGDGVLYGLFTGAVFGWLWPTA